MSTGIKCAWLVGIVFAAPQLGIAQDREFPVLNSVGRYLGIGYTRGGYHAPQDGRLAVVTSRHPALDYRHGGFAPNAIANYLDYPASEFLPAHSPAAPSGLHPGSAVVPGMVAPSPLVPNTLVPGTGMLSTGSPDSLPAPQSSTGNGQPVSSNSASDLLGVSENGRTLAAGEAIGSPSVTRPGLPPGVVTLPPPPTSQSLPAPSIAPSSGAPAVMTSPKDRIEVRELAPPANAGDVLLDHSGSHRIHVRGVTQHFIAQPDGKLQNGEQRPTNRYLTPPIQMN